MNSPEERINEKCPTCAHWGKGHILNIATKKEMCTIKLVVDSELEIMAENLQTTDAGRTLPWRICCTSYAERPKVRPLDKLLWRFRKKNRRYCPMCGKRIRGEGETETGGAFCSMDCAIKFIESEGENGPLQNR